MVKPAGEIYVWLEFLSLRFLSSSNFSHLTHLHWSLPNMPDQFVQVTTRNYQNVSLLLPSNLPCSLCFYIPV